MSSGAEIMVKCLEKENVHFIFGYPGAAICPFYDCLTSSSVHHILVRAEQNAAHMASGYARSCGKAGVCVVTSGPGATNLITGIATAYMDSVPLVIITGQVNSWLLGRDVFQEADITGACESFTKHSYLVNDAAQLPRIFKEAFHIASTGRPGPVLIDVPTDIQQQEVKAWDYPEKAEIRGYKPRTQGHALQIQKALKAIEEAERPIICCGGGVVLANARKEMIAFAHKSGIPICATMMGIGVMPMDSDYYLGMIGMHGRSSANLTMQQADLVVLCGARVGDRAVSAPKQIADKAKIIHIDVDPAEIGKNMPVDIPIVGDVRLVLKSLTEQVTDTVPKTWKQKVLSYKNQFPPRGTPRDDFVEPRVFIRDLSAMMEEDAILVADVGQNQIWAARNFNVKEGRFLTSGGLGTMGYSIPAAIGAKIAKPKRQVVAVCGDGSFQMAMCELGTLIQTNIDIKIIIMQNGTLGMVKEFQDKQYGSRYIGTSLKNGMPDFAKLAASYGICASVAASNAAAKEKAEQMLQHNGPYILICRVDPSTPSI
ncbi:MAG: biosynthetic-type acetolactate synthase large subunit [Oscillospiraceae bacterium]|nr:biosynthetic-type acetolactate synthase large subunit [Oscillospiraceae bacterium]